MFDSITHEALPNGDTLAHFHTADSDVFGYVTFRGTATRQVVRAVIFHEGGMRTLSANYMKRPPYAAWAKDFTDTYH